jgi:hypothetical protein
MTGISEHMEFDLPPLSSFVKTNGVADFLYEPGASEDDQWNGLWGLVRAYNGVRTDLQVLPNNTNGGKQNTTTNVDSFSTATTTSKSTCCGGFTTASADSGAPAPAGSDPGVPTSESVDDLALRRPLLPQLLAQAPAQRSAIQELRWLQLRNQPRAALTASVPRERRCGHSMLL